LSEEIKVKDFMSTNLVVSKPDATILEISNLMNEKKVGTVLIVKDNSILGIVSERDIINRVVSKNLEISKTLASDVMTSNLVFGNPELTDVEVAKIFSDENIKKLPIKNEDNLVGIVTQTDILKLYFVKWAF